MRHGLQNHTRYVFCRLYALFTTFLASAYTRIANFQENISGEVRYSEISTVYLEKIIQYFYYRERYKDCEDFPKFEVGKDILLGVVMASWFLET